MTRDEAIGLFQTYLRRTPQEADIAVHIHKSKESFEAEISACPERTQLLENSLKQAVEDVVLHRMSTLDFRLERGFSGSTSTSYVIDCGAWDGSETLALLKQFPNSMVVVIEPVREMYEKHLLPKLGGNPRVKLLPMAVDGRTGFRKFNVSNKNHFVSSFFDFRTEESGEWGVPLSFDQSYMVPTITLYDVCLMFNIKRIEHIHMDTQGNDLVALKSLGDKIEIVETGMCEASYRLSL